MVAEEHSLRIPPPVAPPALPPEPLGLPPAEVHVWQAHLGPGPADDGPLSQEECERAARLVRVRDRERWIQGRSLLRRILASYEGTPAGELRIERTPAGKPFLPASTLRFNLSHSGERWMLALAREAPVGIDVERLDRRVNVERIAQRMFTDEERLALGRLEGDERTVGFFRAWASKEAAVKAWGTGMFEAGATFSVEVDPKKGPRVRAAPDGSSPLTLAEVGRGNAWAAVLAVESGVTRARSFLLG